MRRIVLSLIAAILFLSTAMVAHADGPRLYVMDCGTISLDSVHMFGIDDSETDVRELFVPCYLIEHNGERLVWDFGLPLNLVGQGEVVPQEGVRLRYEVSLLDQLAELDLGPEDIDFIAPSHLHFDHAGALSAFTQSTLLIQAAEREAILEADASEGVYQPELFSGVLDNPTVQLAGDRDVFGDGKVEIISAPGHTAGHQVLYVELENYGPVVLGGDQYHFRVSRTLRRTPVFNFDRDMTLESMTLIEALLDERSATLWIEHDLALAKTLKMSPRYYD